VSGDEQLTKVDARVTDEVARKYREYESLWARPLGDNEYELRSVPLWVSGLAWGDIVSAPSESPNGLPLVEGVSRRSGHATIMLAIERDATGKPFDRAWSPLDKEGCTWDAFSETLRAIDVPPEANQGKVAKAFEWGRATGIWTYSVLYVPETGGD
jgi:hypothetical protein